MSQTAKSDQSLAVTQSVTQHITKPYVKYYAVTVFKGAQTAVT